MLQTKEPGSVQGPESKCVILDASTWKHIFQLRLELTMQMGNRSNPEPSQQPLVKFNPGAVGVNFSESFTGVFLSFLGFEYLTSWIRAPESY